MGLKEKVALEEFQKTIPSYENALKAQTGQPITIAIDWDSFSNDPDALTSLPNNGINPAISALRELSASSQAGKDAIKAGISKIIIKNIPDPKAKRANVANGALELHGAFGKNGG